MPGFGETLAIILGLVTAPFWLGPLLVRIAQKSAANPAIAPFDPDLLDVPPKAAEYLAGVTPGLVAAGFQVEAYFAMAGDTEGLTTYVALFANQAQRARAIAVVAYLAKGVIEKVHTQYVEFSTGFEDGLEVCTSNLSMPYVFASVPAKVVKHIPQVEEPERVFRAHRAVLAGLGRGQPRALTPGEPIDLFRAAYRAELEGQIETGYLYLDEGAKAYRPTWKGAALMTWKLLPPWKQIAVARDRREAEELLSVHGV